MKGDNTLTLKHTGSFTEKNSLNLISRLASGLYTLYRILIPLLKRDQITVEIIRLLMHNNQCF